MTLSPHIIQELRKVYWSLTHALKGPYLVDQSTQDKELAALQQGVAYERFFFVLDLRDFSIKHATGICQWLGYRDEDFGIEDFFRMTPAGHQAVVSAFNLALMKLLTSGILRCGFAQQRFIRQQPMQHRNGQLFLVKFISSPFQYDSEGRLVAYLNEGTILGPYRGEPLQPRLMDGHQPLQTLYASQLQQEVMDMLTRTLPFSPQEWRIIKIWTRQPAWSSREVAAELGIANATVLTHNKQIVQKAQHWFERTFNSAREVAGYLVEEGVINTLK